MRVSELIRHLEKTPGDPAVGRIGHFGEFHEMAEEDFHWCALPVPEKGLTHVLSVRPPYLGPEPD